MAIDSSAGFPFFHLVTVYARSGSGQLRQRGWRWDGVASGRRVGVVKADDALKGVATGRYNGRRYNGGCNGLRCLPRESGVKPFAQIA